MLSQIPADAACQFASQSGSGRSPFAAFAASSLLCSGSPTFGGGGAGGNKEERYRAWAT